MEGRFRGQKRNVGSLNLINLISRPDSPLSGTLQDLLLVATGFFLSVAISGGMGWDGGRRAQRRGEVRQLEWAQ